MTMTKRNRSYSNSNVKHSVETFCPARLFSRSVLRQSTQPLTHTNGTWHIKRLLVPFDHSNRRMGWQAVWKDRCGVEGVRRSQELLMRHLVFLLFGPFESRRKARKYTYMLVYERLYFWVCEYRCIYVCYTFRYNWLKLTKIPNKQKIIIIIKLISKLPANVDYPRLKYFEDIDFPGFTALKIVFIL